MPPHTTASPPVTEKIGRFIVNRLLGRGAQGVVYEAIDPRLDRTVAIKTLAANSGDARALLTEAKHLSKLSHRYLASVFDIGTQDGAVYIVYEFIEGESLRSLLKAKRLTLGEVLRWMRQILEAVAYAHEEGLVHRDLNPNNIRINVSGDAKVLDFGIATTVGARADQGNGVAGTVNYMAPELIANERIGAPADVFALGLILFEMLTGRKAVDADTSMSALYKITNEAVPLPTDLDASIDPRFNEIITTALAKDPDLRYQSARDMAQAIEAVTLDSDSPEKHSSQSTLVFLLRRMKRKADFPALSKRIGEVNRQIDDDKQHSVNDLANIVLKDYALTTKLLKLVNSSFYGQYSGRISTVSRAIVILGFKQIRIIAQSLMLFENLENKPHTKLLRESASQAVLSGIIAREMATGAKNIDAEEAFICAMVHSLGKFLTMYYLPEEYTEIETHQQYSQGTESDACLQVLGLTYEALGAGVAKEWGLPEFMVASMTPSPPGPVKRANSPLEHCRNLATFANQLCESLTHTEFSEDALTALQRRFQNALTVDKDSLVSVIRTALDCAKEFGPIATDNFEKSRVVQAVASWSSDSTDESVESSGQALGDQSDKDTDTVLNGIQDISNALIENCNLNDILSMILETIYRGLNFSRVILCIADSNADMMVARYGLGEEVDTLVKSFRYPLTNTNDAFSRALIQRTHIVYPKSDMQIADLPMWYRTQVQPNLMILLPIVVGQRCPGAIYCDVIDMTPQFSAKQFNYLSTLRNQAALAIKQR